MSRPVLHSKESAGKHTEFHKYMYTLCKEKQLYRNSFERLQKRKAMYREITNNVQSRQTCFD